MIYDEFEKRIEGHRKLNLKERHEKCWDFYLGDQWKYAQTGGEELPFFNIIEPITEHKIAVVSQNNIAVNIESLDKPLSNSKIFEHIEQLFDREWEKSNMGNIVSELVTHGAVTGDGFLFFGGDNVREPQLIPSSQIILGDENEGNIQEQPYILLIEWKTIAQVKAEAKENGFTEHDIDMIVGDNENGLFIGTGSATDVDSVKIVSVTKLEKINGTVYIGKGVKGLDYEDLRPLETTNNETGEVVAKQTLYPLVHFPWKAYPNKARGVGCVEKLIPNQISINQQLARRLIADKTFSFPKAVYDGSAVTNPEGLDVFGSHIEIQGIGDKPISSYVSYLQPPPVSYNAKNLNDDLMEITRSLSGAGNATLGEIDPRRVASSTLEIIREQANEPLAKQMQRLRGVYEDIIRIWIEIWKVYSDKNIKVVKPDSLDGHLVETGEIDPNELREIDFELRIDVSQDTAWSKASEEQKLEAWLDKDYISFKEYVELTSSRQINKQKLKQIIVERENEMRKMQEADAYRSQGEGDVGLDMPEPGMPELPKRGEGR